MVVVVVEMRNHNVFLNERVHMLEGLGSRRG